MWKIFSICSGVNSPLFGSLKKLLFYFFNGFVPFGFNANELLRQDMFPVYKLTDKYKDFPRPKWLNGFFFSKESLPESLEPEGSPGHQIRVDCRPGEAAGVERGQAAVLSLHNPAEDGAQLGRGGLVKPPEDTALQAAGWSTGVKRSLPRFSIYC